MSRAARNRYKRQTFDRFTERPAFGFSDSGYWLWIYDLMRKKLMLKRKPANWSRAGFFMSGEVPASKRGSVDWGTLLFVVIFFFAIFLMFTQDFGSPKLAPYDVRERLEQIEQWEEDEQKRTGTTLN